MMMNSALIIMDTLSREKIVSNKEKKSLLFKMFKKSGIFSKWQVISKKKKKSSVLTQIVDVCKFFHYSALIFILLLILRGHAQPSC